MLLCCVFPRAYAYGRPALASDFIFLCKAGCTFSKECGFPCRILPKFWKTCNGLFANPREPCALLHVLGKFKEWRESCNWRCSVQVSNQVHRIAGRRCPNFVCPCAHAYGIRWKSSGKKITKKKIIGCNHFFPLQLVKFQTFEEVQARFTIFWCFNESLKIVTYA